MIKDHTKSCKDCKSEEKDVKGDKQGIEGRRENESNSDYSSNNSGDNEPLLDDYVNIPDNTRENGFVRPTTAYRFLDDVRDNKWLLLIFLIFFILLLLLIADCLYNDMKKVKGTEHF
ncbi:uncharacterized protein LOC123688850 [Harmonia axyridis]|uniref:uncharacterized protein LOC123688850 n=1 Tax=Harmonia axyridis TaxID=115357 RepID=UPI001E2771BC|nr:uncharacterized protein LOC123688850 [Harmonia axyridis]